MEDLNSEENIILEGDFNCRLNPALDKHGGVMITRRAAIYSIETLQSELDLVDIVWRIKNPQTRSYTWSQKSPTVLCRVDFWLVSNNLCDFINATEIQPAITLALGDIGEIKGPGIWKTNVSLLEDDNYLEQLRINIPKWKQEGEIDLSDKRCVWDWIKYNIRLHAISYSKEKAKLKYEKE